MSFGDCQECGVYKYLEENRTCVTCLEDEEEWIVVVHVPHMGIPEVCERGLSKEEAQEIADDDAWLVARPSHHVS